MRIVAFIISMSFFAFAHSQSVPSIATLDIELKSKTELPLGKSISFILETTAIESVIKTLKNWQNISVEPLENGTLLIEMNTEARFSGMVKEQYLDDSFVIDFSENSTLDFTSAFVTKEHSTIELKQLEAYVDGYVDKPTYVNGFNIASVVARERSGDCTEYAVLLAALSRSIGLAARVVIGTVILEENDMVRAFGHAWVEVWHDQQWNTIDAALYKSSAIQHFYLPAAALENEGPGFIMSLAGATRMLPIKISALQNSK